MSYSWKEADTFFLVNFCKEQRHRIYCEYCEKVLIDIAGQMRTKDRILEGSVNDCVVIRVHESCLKGFNKLS